MRLDHAAYTWYALTTPPQKELVVERLLTQTGFATFVPTRKEWRFANRIARAKRRKTEKTYPLIPRYVFTGFSAGTPSWHQAFGIHLVKGVVGFGDVPYVIPHEPLWRLMRQHNAGRFNAPEWERYMQTHREFGPGDKVITDDGLWEGRVVEIRGQTARIFIELFGAEREVEVATETLVAAQ